ncbi:MAG: GGDEF domain-containing protein [Gammaproteobacteria bacterium]|nr:GGDEF domain-containing protein [Gammaproteobacteria bacterium]NNF48268.1 GGDEF domain-containing protein [Woeseiaceae bacterium]MBT8093881.1 GGDEF domain-containing protein [Gammaproteobacteria bacterium]MBT8104451.1 GGDEF domain-containing protein [Gammaproteobacteria bacterium]NNK24467.1 GGDEF domain-containing protein [Woeseiaceae bacterium]
MKTRLISDRKCDLYGAALASATFLFDIYHPLGIAGAMPYIALPLLGLLARSSRAVINLALLGTILNVGGVALSGTSLYVSMVNHLMSGILVCIVAYIALTHLAVGDSLRASLHDAAFRDPLTGLYNRRYVFNILRDEFRKYQRYANPFSVMLIDADHFKRINDQFGHLAGDAALKAIADVCSESVRETDIVGRFGGEEFIILLPHTRATDAKIVAERIRNTMLESELHWEGQRLDVRLSLGVAEAGLHATDFDELITAADEALYAAKEGGRNQTVVAEIASDSTGVFRLHVVAA